MRLPFVGPTYRHRTPNISVQRCINLYPEMNEAPPGKEGDVSALLSTPGSVPKIREPLIGAFGTEIRALYVTPDNLLAMFVGPGIFFLDTNDVLTAYDEAEGYVPTSGPELLRAGPVSVADNGQFICWVDGQDGFYMTVADHLARRITSPNFYAADNVVFLGGYFIFNRKGTGQFFISGLYEPTFDSLDFATAEGSPDTIVALAANNSELWIFGEYSTEIWYNSGNADFPFERVQGAFVEYGCAATFSVAKAGGSLIWLGKDRQGDGVVVMNNGYTPERISTHPIEQLIQSFGVVSDARAYTYQQDGHLFYVINFTNANTTLVYDLTTKLWHERAYWNVTDAKFERQLGNCHAHYNGESVVGSYRSVQVYALEQKVATDDGAPIIRLRSSPHISKELVQVYYNSLQLDMETGVGLDALPEPGQDPQVMLRWSDDGGHTWSNEHWVSAGRIGVYKTRALWRRLGRSRDRVFEVRISDPNPVTILGATLDVAAGDH